MDAEKNPFCRYAPHPGSGVCEQFCRCSSDRVPGGPFRPVWLFFRRSGGLYHQSRLRQGTFILRQRPDFRDSLQHPGVCGSSHGCSSERHCRKSISHLFPDPGIRSIRVWALCCEYVLHSCWYFRIKKCCLCHKSPWALQHWQHTVIQLKLGKLCNL